MNTTHIAGSLEACPECHNTDLRIKLERGHAVEAYCSPRDGGCGYSYHVKAPVAAAPEMLEALKAAAIRFDKLYTECDKHMTAAEGYAACDKAIAKAEGR